MKSNLEGDSQKPARSTSKYSGGLAAVYLFDACGAVVQNAILARYLQLHDYGVLAALLSVGMFVFVVSDFGTGLAVCRVMALGEHSDRARRFGELWVVRGAMTAATTTAAVAIAWTLAPSLLMLVLTIVGSELFRSMSNFLAAAARGLGRVPAVVGITGIERLATLSCSVLAVGMGWGLQGVAIAYLGARILACFWACGWAFSAGLTVGSWLPGKGLWKECMGLAPLATLLLSDKVVFYSMPLILVAGSTASETGLFNAAMKIGLVPISLCSALLAAYFPDMVRDAAEDVGPRSAMGLYFLVSVIGTPLIALCITAPETLLVTVFGPAFVSAGMTLRWIALFIVLNIAYQVSVHLLPAYGRERVLLRSASLGALLCLLTAAVGVRSFGATGAACAIVVYALAALIPNVSALRGAFRLNSPQLRVVLQGWLWLALSVVLAAPLGFLGLDGPVLMLVWIGLSGMVGLSLLFRHREVLLPLISNRRSFETVPRNLRGLENGGSGIP